MITIALLDFLVALDLLIVFISFGIAVLLDYSLPQCKGKEKAPTHAFQVIVSYTNKVLFVSDVHFVCNKDKDIADKPTNIQWFKSLIKEHFTRQELGILLHKHLGGCVVWLGR